MNRHEFGGPGRHRVPTDDFAGEDINDESHVNEPCPGSTIRKISNPHPIGTRSGEVTIQPVTGAFAISSGDRGSMIFPTDHTD